MEESKITVGLSDLLLEYTGLRPWGSGWMNDFQELRQFAYANGFLMEELRRLTRREIEAIRNFEVGPTLLSTNSMEKLRRKQISFRLLNSAERFKLRKYFNLMDKDERIEITEKMLLEIDPSRKIKNMIAGFIRPRIPIRPNSQTCYDLENSPVPVDLHSLLLEYTQRERSGSNRMNRFRVVKQFASENGFSMEELASLTRSQIEAIRDFEIGPPLVPYHLLEKLRSKEVSFSQLSRAKKTILRDTFDLTGEDETIEITENMLLKIYPSLGLINMISSFVKGSHVQDGTSSSELIKSKSSDVVPVCKTHDVQVIDSESTVTPTVDFVPCSVPSLKENAHTDESKHPIGSLNSAIKPSHPGMPLFDNVNALSILDEEKNSVRACSKNFDEMKDGIIPASLHTLLLEYTERKPSDSNPLNSFRELRQFASKNGLSMDELASLTRNQIEAIRDFEIGPPLVPYHLLEKLRSKEVTFNQLSRSKKSILREKFYLTGEDETIEITENMLLKIYPSLGLINMISSFVKGNHVRAQSKIFDEMDDSIIPAGLHTLILEYTERKPSDSNPMNSFNELRQFASANGLSMEDLATLTRSQIVAIKDFKISPPLVPYHLLQKLRSKEVSFSQLSRAKKCSLREKLDLTGEDETIEITDSMLLKIYPSLGLINMISSFVERNHVREDTDGSKLIKSNSLDVVPDCKTKEVIVFESESTVTTTVNFVSSSVPSLDDKVDTNETPINSFDSEIIASHLEIPLIDTDNALIILDEEQSNDEIDDGIIPSGLHNLILEYTERKPSDSNPMNNFNELRQFASANSLSMDELASLTRSQIEAIRDFEIGPPLVPYHLLEKLRSKEVSFSQLGYAKKASLRKKFDLTGEDETIEITESILLKIYPSLGLINMISSFLERNQVRENKNGSKLLKSKSSDVVPDCKTQEVLVFESESTVTPTVDFVSCSVTSLEEEVDTNETRHPIDSVDSVIIASHLEIALLDTEKALPILDEEKNCVSACSKNVDEMDEIPLLDTDTALTIVDEEENRVRAGLKNIDEMDEILLLGTDTALTIGDREENSVRASLKNVVDEIPLLDTDTALTIVDKEENSVRASSKTFDELDDGIIPAGLHTLLLEYTERKPSNSNPMNGFSELKRFACATGLSMEELATLTRSQIEAIRDFEIGPPLVPYHLLEKLCSKEVSFSQLSLAMKCSLREKFDLRGEEDTIEITESMLLKIYPSLGLINIISSFVEGNQVGEEANGSEVIKSKSSDVVPNSKTEEVPVVESQCTVPPTVDFVSTSVPSFEEIGDTYETRHPICSLNSAKIASHLEQPLLDTDEASSIVDYEKNSKIPASLHTLLFEYTERKLSGSNLTNSFSELRQFASENGLSMEELASLTRNQIEAIRDFEIVPPLVPYHLLEKLRSKEVSFSQLSRAKKCSLRDKFHLTGEDETIEITENMLLKIYPSLGLINMICSFVKVNHVWEEINGLKLRKPLEEKVDANETSHSVASLNSAMITRYLEMPLLGTDEVSSSQDYRKKETVLTEYPKKLPKKVEECTLYHYIDLPTQDYNDYIKIKQVASNIQTAISAGDDQDRKRTKRETSLTVGDDSDPFLMLDNFELWKPQNSMTMEEQSSSIEDTQEEMLHIIVGKQQSNVHNSKHQDSPSPRQLPPNKKIEMGKRKLFSDVRNEAATRSKLTFSIKNTPVRNFLEPNIFKKRRSRTPSSTRISSTTRSMSPQFSRAALSPLGMVNSGKISSTTKSRSPHSKIPSSNKRQRLLVKNSKVCDRSPRPLRRCRSPTTSNSSLKRSPPRCRSPQSSRKRTSSKKGIRSSERNKSPVSYSKRRSKSRDKIPHNKSSIPRKRSKSPVSYNKRRSKSRDKSPHNKSSNPRRRSKSPVSYNKRRSKSRDKSPVSRRRSRSRDRRSLSRRRSRSCNRSPISRRRSRSSERSPISRRRRRIRDKSPFSSRSSPSPLGDSKVVRQKIGFSCCQCSHNLNQPARNVSPTPHISSLPIAALSSSAPRVTPLPLTSYSNYDSQMSVLSSAYNSTILPAFDFSVPPPSYNQQLYGSTLSTSAPVQYIPEIPSLPGSNLSQMYYAQHNSTTANVQDSYGIHNHTIDRQSMPSYKNCCSTTSSDTRNVDSVKTCVRRDFQKLNQTKGNSSKVNIVKKDPPRALNRSRNRGGERYSPSHISDDADSDTNEVSLGIPSKTRSDLRKTDSDNDIANWMDDDDPWQ